MESLVERGIHFALKGEANRTRQDTSQVGDALDPPEGQSRSLRI